VINVKSSNVKELSESSAKTLNTNRDKANPPFKVGGASHLWWDFRVEAKKVVPPTLNVAALKRSAPQTRS
jgi:hypothetical protein